RVDYGRHLLDVVEEQPVEEHLVRVLERAQVDVPLEVFVLAPIRLVGARHLLVERLDVRRKKPEQSEITPFLLAERRPFVQDREVEKRHASRAGGLVHGRSRQFEITVSVTSFSSPAKTILVIASANPLACAIVAFGGIASTFGSVTTSSSAGPVLPSTRSSAGRTSAGSSTRTLSSPSA